MAVELQGVINELLEGSIKTIGKVPVINELNVFENGIYTPPSGVDGFAPVNVNIPDPELVTLNVTENGTYTPSSNIDGFNEVVVNVPKNEPNIIMKDRILMESQGGYVTVNYDEGKTLENGKYYLFAFKLLANDGLYYYKNFLVKWNNENITLEFRENFWFDINVNSDKYNVYFTGGGSPYTFRGKITELNNIFVYE
jgi:hypothetical protein